MIVFLTYPGVVILIQQATKWRRKWLESNWNSPEASWMSNAPHANDISTKLLYGIWLHWISFDTFLSNLYLNWGHQERMCTVSGPSSQRFHLHTGPPSPMWGPIIMIYKCVVDKLVQMSNGEIWFKKNSEKRQTSRSEDAKWTSLRIHDQSCRHVRRNTPRNISLFPYPHGTIFSYFY